MPVKSKSGTWKLGFRPTGVRSESFRRRGEFRFGTRRGKIPGEQCSDMARSLASGSVNGLIQIYRQDLIREFRPWVKP